MESPFSTLRTRQPMPRRGCEAWLRAFIVIRVERRPGEANRAPRTQNTTHRVVPTGRRTYRLVPALQAPDLRGCGQAVLLVLTCEDTKLGVFFMAKPTWREGRITKNCRDCGAQTTGYVDTGKEPYAVCIDCAKAKGLLIDQKAG